MHNWTWLLVAEMINETLENCRKHQIYLKKTFYKILN